MTPTSNLTVFSLKRKLPSPKLKKLPSKKLNFVSLFFSFFADSIAMAEYKTRWCMYERGKTCPRKSYCDFAHSESELQRHNPHYKHWLCFSVQEGYECKDLMCCAAHSENEWLRIVTGLPSPTIAQWQNWMLTHYHQTPCPLAFRHDYISCSGFHIRTWSELKSDRNDQHYKSDTFHTEECLLGDQCKVNQPLIYNPNTSLALDGLFDEAHLCIT